jgi:hypothetical protein
MIPSIYGLIVLGISLLMMVFKRPLREFLLLLPVSAVFGSTEAVALPMLGGASLTVPYFFVLFFVLRLLFTIQAKSSLGLAAIRANLWILLFAVYGILAAFLLPSLFEGSMSVISMRPLPYRVPVTPSSQNITQAFYIVLTALTALATYVAARQPKADKAMMQGWYFASILFVIFGLVDLIGFYVFNTDLLEFLKTASYAMLSQFGHGVRRVSGSFAEPSAFAGFGAAPILLLLYLWAVDYQPSKTGLVGMGVTAILTLSTSSTGFVMIAVALLTVGISVLSAPMPVRTRQKKFIVLWVAVIGTLIGGIALAALMPQFADSFTEVFQEATVKKAESQSAVERGMWAQQGIDAFFVSKGLGIGPGSFRSSGLFHSIIGSMGVVGAASFLFYLFKVVGVAQRRIPQTDRRLIVGHCLLAVLMLIAPGLTSPSPDPGIIFAMAAGFALGRQRQAVIEAKRLSNMPELEAVLPDEPYPVRQRPAY